MLRSQGDNSLVSMTNNNNYALEDKNKSSCLKFYFENKTSKTKVKWQNSLWLWSELWSAAGKYRNLTAFKDGPKNTCYWRHWLQHYQMTSFFKCIRPLWFIYLIYNACLTRQAVYYRCHFFKARTPVEDRQLTSLHQHFGIFPLSQY